MSDPELLSAKTSRRLSPALLVLLIVPVLGLIGAVAMLLTNTPPSTAPAGDATPFVGRVGSLDQPLPEFELVDLDGQPVDLAAYAGRPVFVNFWGTWCPPCVRELPEMQAFAAAQGPDGAVVIASNNTESPDVIRAYFADNALDLPDIVFVQDNDSAMYRWFGIYQMPTTFLVDAEQIVRSVKYGPFDQAGMTAYLNELAN
ncbi:MAG: TlpA family protein disulfide reductase [Chloroflexi bacterium]|nr:MAG: alkyl hydroperoxide reductase/ Thiol specific antioxidant/ Mal allergen [Chloroflexi bacterium OLB13]MBV6437017.1 Thiol-disulfide oxidoreductase ResA [Anaerolineae bacterium]MCC6565072.1 TlpA family protein disulfide reductase [Chloroflexota bacterium]MBW7877672.1 TlpA family protein disulfide reductase [Anaerolineae bacterium]MEB2367016.1 TlpA disulfide reductase family protein [Chloroflexota bacterium]